MKEFTNDGSSNAEENEDLNGVQLDPSSISLFSTGNDTPADVSSISCAPSTSTLNSAKPVQNDQSFLLSSDTNTLSPPVGLNFTNKKSITEPAKRDEKNKKQQSYTSYVAGKATEVAKRRNLNERIGRLQSSHGILFNVPQCQNITLNQLAIFLRRLRKSTDVRALMSPELMLKIFQEDADLQKNASQQTQTQNQQHPAVISVNEVLGSDDEIRQRDDEDEVTEASSESDEEFDHERPTTSKNMEFTMNERNFYRERMELLAADSRAQSLHRRLCEAQQKARSAYATLSGDFQFESLPQTSDQRENTMTCARCRPLLNRPSRDLVNIDWAGTRMRKQRSMTSNTVCGPIEYAEVDDSIHPYLSLPSSIPMERKIHKYLQVSSTLPAEIERRRLKTAQLAYKKDDRVLRSFRFTEELSTMEEEESPSAISLKLKKKIPKPLKPEKVQSPVEEEEWQSTDDGLQDSDTEDEYPHPLAPKIKKKKESNSHSRKPVVSESRRASVHSATNHDFGSSVFDYDPAFMEIGLTAVQNVDNVEIAIPSFRKKDFLDRSLKRPCESCPSTADDPLAEIRKLHSTLEAQEKQRFRIFKA